MISAFLPLFEQTANFSIMMMLLSFLWGIFSVIFCPCHLATLPLFIGMMEQPEKSKYIDSQRAIIYSLLFSGGILLSLILMLQFVFMPFFSHWRDYQEYFYYGIAIFLFYLATDFLDLLPSFLHPHPAMKMKLRYTYEFLIVGFIYGIALSPCTIAFMSPIMAVCFIGDQLNIHAVLYLFMFCIGNVILILLAGIFTSFLQRFLKWNVHSTGVKWTRKLCGVFLLLAGFWTLYLI